MTRYLLTPSLYSSWSYFYSSEKKTKQDFLNTLLKIKEPPTENMLKGIKLEEDIRSVCEGRPWSSNEDEDWGSVVLNIAEIVRGGLWQESVSKEVNIFGMTFLLYGKADNVKRDWIYDIKFTENYDIGKYLENIQHDLYMVCAEIPNFSYLITDGSNFWREDYHLESYTENHLKTWLAAMVENIFSDQDFKKAYLENWKADSKPKDQSDDWILFAESLRDEVKKCKTQEEADTLILPHLKSLDKMRIERPTLHKNFTEKLSDFYKELQKKNVSK